MLWGPGLLGLNWAMSKKNPKSLLIPKAFWGLHPIGSSDPFGLPDPFDLLKGPLNPRVPLDPKGPYIPYPMGLLDI